MDLKNVIVRDNTFQAKIHIALQVSKRNQFIASMTMSNEYTVNGLMFQIKSMNAVFYDARDIYIGSSSNLYVQFTKEREMVDCHYKMTVNSLELGIIDKELTNDDGTWYLIHETPDLRFSFLLTAKIELLTRMSPPPTIPEEDFELRAVDGRIRVHRATLISSSPVFRRMLDSHWKEDEQGHVNIADVSVSSLQHLKFFMYTRTMSHDNLEELLLMSTRYMMCDLERQCVEQMASRTTAENVMRVLKFAACNGIMRLTIAVLELVERGLLNVTDIHRFYEEKEEE